MEFSTHFFNPLPPHPGSNSGSPLIHSEESDQNQIIDLNFGLSAYFRDFFNQIPPAISNRAVPIDDKSSTIPGMPPKTNLAQFNEVITAASCMTPPTLGSALQSFSPFDEKDILKSAVRQLGKKSTHYPPKAKKRRIEGSKQKEPERDFFDFLSAEVLKQENAGGIWLKEKDQKEIKREFAILSKQYDNVESEDFIILKKEKMSDALNNLDKNQNKQDLPYNASRFHDDLLGSNFYFNASVLPCLPILESKTSRENPKDPWNNSTILGEDPFEETIKSFWQMVYYANSTIVMITSRDLEERIEYCPDQETEIDWGSLSIKSHSQPQLNLHNSEADVYSRMLSIKHKEEEKDRITLQWLIIQKTKDYLLDAQSMLTCIKEINLFSGESSVIFHSQSCISGTGSLLAICHFLFQIHQRIQKAKQSMKIDVFELVICLREYCRYGMIHTLEEYQLIYDFLHLLQQEKPKPRYKVRQETLEEAAKYTLYNTPRRSQNN